MSHRTGTKEKRPTAQTALGNLIFAWGRASCSAPATAPTTTTSWSGR